MQRFVLVNTNEKMMSSEPPTPPVSRSTEVVNARKELEPNHFRDIARYAEELAEHKERRVRIEEG